ncbi:hypothetical protein GY45DRAFT_1341312, partial [Cubamyces sp. BRFM 1775]
MKDTVLEGRLRQIEKEEKARRVRAAVILSKRKPKSIRSRTEVMQRMMRRMKQASHALKREAQRPITQGLELRKWKARHVSFNIMMETVGNSVLRCSITILRSRRCRADEYGRPIGSWWVYMEESRVFTCRPCYDGKLARPSCGYGDQSRSRHPAREDLVIHLNTHDTQTRSDSDMERHARMFGDQSGSPPMLLEDARRPI